jgi:hypothetical protein
MPAEKRTICLFVEPDYLERLWAIGTLKKQEFYLCGCPAPDSEIGAIVVERCAQGVAPSPSNLIRADLSAG